MCIMSFELYAQIGSNSIYSSNSGIIKVLEKPSSRKVYGGTVINVNYVGNKISSTVKGAFEHACRIWEENIPTAYPINLTVEFSNTLFGDCLATVETEHGGSTDDYDKIYTKRYAMLYGAEYSPLDENNNTLEYFRDTQDARIIFSNSQPFDYSLDANNISSNKYDFVTVALQAIGKALGFTLKAYTSGNTLNKLNPNNRFTSSILKNSNTSAQNYTLATSGAAYIESGSLGKIKGKWYLHSPAAFDAKTSLNYFKKDPDNKETLIMQPDIISKGSAIRYIGDGMQVFFSFCGWDRSFVTGMSSSTYEGTSTDEVLPYMPINQLQTPKVAAINNTDTDISTYLSERLEDGDDGNYVLMKDGSWKKYNRRNDLTDNTNYARTSDGYLRLKEVTSSFGPNGAYRNVNVKHLLSDYIPQKPDVSMNSYKFSDEYSVRSTSRRSYTSSMLSDGAFMDVEIGFKNTEGCTEVLVEQTDSDYPVPYFYYVDPSAGYFTALMNKDYPSDFKLTYINKNGETESEPFTVNLTNIFIPLQPNISITINDNILHFSLMTIQRPDDPLAPICQYYITDPDNLNVYAEGTCNEPFGDIDISNLQSGKIYILKVFYKSKMYSKKWMKS